MNDDSKKPLAYLITFRTYASWLHGSTEYLWLERDLYFPREYTVEKQGKKMAYYFDERPYVTH